MNVLPYLFWNVIRKNKVSNAAWMYFKRGTLLPLLINRMNPYPTGVEVEVTTVCNLRCRMCEMRYWPASEKKLMSFEKFKYIIDQFPDLRWAGVTGIGSCFLNPEIEKMFQYCKSKGVLIEYAESYAKLDHAQIETIIEYCDHLTVSLDSSKKAVYNDFRQGADFDTTISNIKYMLSLRKDGHPKVVFHFVINKINMDEATQYPAFIASLNPGQNTVIMFSRLLHNFPEIADMYMEVPPELQAKVEAEGLKYGIPISWNCNIPKKKPTTLHCLEFCEPYILIDGSVQACCCLNETNNRPFQREHALGNIFEKSFKEIWYGSTYASLRASLRKNKMPYACQGCILYQESK